MRDVKSANGFIVARVDSTGNVTLGPEAGPVAGRIGSAGEIFDDDGGAHQLGRVDGEGNVYDEHYELVGRVDAWGRVYNPLGDLIGTVEQPADAGVLLLIAPPASPAKQTASGAKDDDALMKEALDLGETQSMPGVRKNYKPLTDRDLFMEHLPRE